MEKKVKVTLKKSLFYLAGKTEKNQWKSYYNYGKIHEGGGIWIESLIMYKNNQPDAIVKREDLIFSNENIKYGSKKYVNLGGRKW